MLTTSARLKDVEEGKTDPLLHLRVPLDLDIGMLPEFVQKGPLLCQQPLPTGQARSSQRRHHLVMDSRPRALTRPAISDKLDDPQPFAWLQLGGDRDAGNIGRTFS